MKRVAVFGASGAIGSAFVDLLSQYSELVYAFSQSDYSNNKTNVVCHKFDYQNEDSIKNSARIIDADLDLIIVATGLLHSGNIMPEKSLLEVAPDNLLKLYYANTVVPAMIIKHFHKLLAKDYTSKFALLSARVGSISDNSLGGWYSYRCSKSALNMLIKSAAIELKRINSNAIIFGLHPGTVDSKLSQPFQKNVPDGKLFTPEFSVKELIKVINDRKHSDSGLCFAWDGEIIIP